ncbi:helix-turn-helix domain-containing protein [Mycobacterium frederiksbergense]|uniref:IclR family transcriptional regulator n=1 Tax=Mycolicibacterium frederiksbergense TaxID=117567 RepID=UPI0021F2AF36|nr:helix-turn-helix domain-containing protein [Mycolicibacterium frederiksbergense]MCV7045452.1 helix-turn-helix domain-containing protein [Mycolicibacterium frederiksbergense]
MARRSPQTERLVEMVEYLAADPHREYQLTELARLVNLDAATCHPMLTELTRVGWLVKDRVHKTYRLGPRLISVGASAQASLQIATYARPEMQRVSTETGVPACLFIPSSDDLVIADLTYPDGEDSGHLPLQAGDHIEFGPPLGAVLAAWAGQYTVDTWLRRVEPGPDDPGRTWQILRTIRERRFSVELSPASQAEMRELTDFAIGEVHGSRRAARMIGGQRPVMTPELMLGDIDDAAVYAPLSVSAACFDPGGNPVAALSVLTMAEPRTGRELRDLGASVSAAADAITARLHGR